MTKFIYIAIKIVFTILNSVLFSFMIDLGFIVPVRAWTERTDVRLPNSLTSICQFLYIPKSGNRFS